MQNNELLKTEKLTLTYENPGGGKLQIFKDFDFSMQRGDRVAVLGASGCGKTSLLLSLAGLVKPCSGRVIYKGSELLKADRSISVMLQDYGLFPWKTVYENVKLPLRLSGKAFEKKDIDYWLERTQMSDFAKQYPSRLSGGQRQRVAIARAMISRPDLFLMDEVFSALDLNVREKLQDMLLGICKDQNSSMVFVTHDLDEALFLSTKILLFKKDGIKEFENKAAVCARSSAIFQSMRVKLHECIREDYI